LKPENNTPSIGFLKNKMSEKLILTIIKLHIIDLSDFLNLTRPLKESQVEQTAEMIIDEFPLMKIADVIYLFKKAKNGEFGNIYEGLDGLKILSWFREVWCERLDYAEYQSGKDHQDKKYEHEKIFGSARTCGSSDPIQVEKAIKRNEEWLLVQMDKTPINTNK